MPPIRLGTWCLLFFGLSISAFGQSGPREFEVASIKLNSQCDNRPGQYGMPVFSPGRLQMTCVSLERLIQIAYIDFADGVTISRQVLDITGGPNWIRSDRYDLIAKAGDKTGIAQLHGPMLQKLLEERFQLKVHREAKPGPVYSLTAARGGLKLSSVKEGACLVRDLDHMPAAQAPGQPMPTYCGDMKIDLTRTTLILDGRAINMTQFAQWLAFWHLLDRPVLDKTGYSGRFDFHLECSRDLGGSGGAKGGGGRPSRVDDADPSVLADALQQQLGLKLISEKGPVEFLVVDRAERPTAN